MIARASWDRLRANIEMKGNKMQYTTVLFDLDGTLTESAPGIVNSAAHALEKFGIHVEDKNDLLCFVGPPLIESFQKYYGLDEKNALKQIKKINKERQKHYKFYTNREWTNQNNYDLSINVDKYGVEKTADIICNFIK